MKSLNEIANQYGKRIDNWMRLKSSVLLISRYPDGLKTVEGRIGGTYAVEEIAKEFEQWCKKGRQDTPCRVYFIRAVGKQVFKVGIASDPRSRLRSLQIGSPVKLVLTRDIECVNAFAVEQKIHERFSEYRAHGEWFSCPIDKALMIFDEYF